jgi:hypothetical protein
MRERCIPPTAKVRSILLVDDYPALLRARRKHQRGWDEATRELYRRHRWHIEGVHGRAKSYHGLRRAVRRGLSNVHIQSCLAATAMNLKKLAAHSAPARLLAALYRHWNRPKMLPAARFAFAA